MTAGEHLVQTSELRLFLALAAEELTEKQRWALYVWLEGRTERDAASENGTTRTAVWIHRRAALRKMRERLNRAGIYSSSDLLQG